LGGPAAAADKSATPLVGSDRYGTAAGVAAMFFPSATLVGVATGTNFPDALAAGPDLGAKGAPLLLVAPSGALPGGPTAALLALSSTVTGAEIFGGTASVGDDVAAQVGTLAAIGGVATAANASAIFTGRYGVLVETVTGTKTVPITQVFDGNTGAVTAYASGVAPTTGTAPTAAQLAALPTGAAALETDVNTLFASYDTSVGLTTTDPDALFLLNAAQVFLDPNTPPTVRLAVYAALAALPTTTVTSGVKDSTGRTGIEISAAVTGSTASDSGTISYLFDPATVLPLQNKLVTSTGSLVDMSVITSLSTTTTLPTNPYSS
jgi:hypothetical protein